MKKAKSIVARSRTPSSVSAVPVRPFQNMPFIVDLHTDNRCFWQPPDCPQMDIAKSGKFLAEKFAAAAVDPNVGMLLPAIVESMTGAKEASLAGTQACAFLMELARMASVGAIEMQTMHLVAAA